MAYTIGFYMFYQLLEFRVIRGRDSRLHFQTEEAEIYGSINKISLILSHIASTMWTICIRFFFWLSVSTDCPSLPIR